MKQKLKTKDLIYAGAFAALFIIVMGFGIKAFGLVGKHGRSNDAFAHQRKTTASVDLDII